MSFFEESTVKEVLLLFQLFKSPGPSMQVLKFVP